MYSGCALSGSTTYANTNVRLLMAPVNPSTRAMSPLMRFALGLSSGAPSKSRGNTMSSVSTTPSSSLWLHT